MPQERKMHIVVISAVEVEEVMLRYLVANYGPGEWAGTWACPDHAVTYRRQMLAPTTTTTETPQ